MTAPMSRHALPALLALAASAAMAAPANYAISKIAKDDGVKPNTAEAISNNGNLTGQAVVDFFPNAPFVRIGDTSAGLGFIGPGQGMTGNDVNLGGQVIGTVVGSGGQPVATLWERDGSIKWPADTLSCGGGTLSASRGIAINTAAVAVGTYTCGWGDDAVTKGYIFQVNFSNDPGTLGGKNTLVNGVNSIVQVVGGSQVASPDGQGAYHAFVWQGGTMKDIHPTGTVASQAVAVNDQGQVVISGLHDVGSDVPSSMYLYQNGTTKLLPRCKRGTNLSINAINNHGQMVGYYYPAQAEGKPVGVLIEQGKCYRLQDLIKQSDGAWNSLQANDINDSGVIVGTGNRGAFMMKPQALR